MSEVNENTNEIEPATQESITDIGIPEISMSLTVSDTILQGTDENLTAQGQPADAKAVGDRFDLVDGTIGDIQLSIAEIDDTMVTKTMLDAIFPVGSIYVTTATTGVPDELTGTWEEIVMPMTWGDLEDGTRSYQAGASSGNLHFYRRTA